MHELIVRYAMQFVGLPYRWGGDDTIDGFDCSGFVQELLAAVDMDPPGDQTAAALLAALVQRGAKHIVSPEPGAVCFFGTSDSHISHVGFAVSGWQMLEAGGGGSKTTSKEAAASQNAYIRLRPISRRNDLVAIVMPAYRGV